MPFDASVDPGEVERCVADLARFGAHGPTGVSRPVYSPAWSAAQSWVADQGRAAGLSVSTDAVGNVWAQLPGELAGEVVAIGSHIDSQLPGGRFDGALGVIAGLIAVRLLARRCGRPRRSLAVVSLCEEESSRFAASMWGSRAVVGAAGDVDPSVVHDADGITLAQAMRDVGLDPSRIASAQRSDLVAFLELHIEQGPLLEQAGVPVGVVTAITGIRHYEVTLTGRADHAGARPIDDRRDALLGAAEITAAVGASARAAGRPAVMTVGRMEVSPGIAAAVAEQARFTIDVRHPDAAALAMLCASVEKTVAGVAARNGLLADVSISLDLRPTGCAPGLVEILQEAATAGSHEWLTLHSGAAHDSQRLATVTDVAMLFVRSMDGRSHTPAEFTSTADAVAGIETLMRALHRLTY